MKITGQNYDELTEVQVQWDCVVLTLCGTTITLDPEGAIKVAHALIEAAEKIVKK